MECGGIYVGGGRATPVFPAVLGKGLGDIELAGHVEWGWVGRRRSEDGSGAGV